MTKRALLRILEREREAHATQVSQLIDTICHLSGRPWNVPPIDLQDTEPEKDFEPMVVQAHHWPD